MTNHDKTISVDKGGGKGEVYSYQLASPTGCIAFNKSKENYPHLVMNSTRISSSCLLHIHETVVVELQVIQG